MEPETTKIPRKTILLRPDTYSALKLFKEHRSFKSFSDAIDFLLERHADKVPTILLTRPEQKGVYYISIRKDTHDKLQEIANKYKMHIDAVVRRLLAVAGY